MANSNSIVQIIFLFNLFLTSQSLNFTYHGFNNTNINLVQATIIKPSGALRLTNTSQYVIGHAFHPSSIPISNNSFSTYFVFQIVPSTSNRGGYGLSFTLSPSPSFPNGDPGHLLGVFNETNAGLSSNHIFMVEFDTVSGYNKNEDTDGNHVGVNINGMNSTFSMPAAYLIEGTRGKNEEIYFEKGQPIQTWIDYDGYNKVVNVTVAPFKVDKPIKPLISEVLDLSTFLLENMYAGFSAATGRKSSSHYILGWSFRLNGIADPLDESKLPVVVVENSSSSDEKVVKKALFATFSVVIFVALVVVVSVCFYRRIMNFETLECWELDSPHRFKYNDLYKATKGFKESEKIGVGGFGAVYRGVLKSTSAEVAVKRIMPNNPLQGMKEFAAEIECLGRLRHKNLVNLQGWCKNKNDLLLVYDFISNGSLDSLLYKSDVVLSWEQRFNIIKGVASGLLYLHEEWEQVVIHRDVKSSNVLIDRDMNPKLGDFGLARLYDHGKNSHTTSVVGTIGYIAPELTRTGKPSTSTDVFAYGILLLEVACGRAPVVYEANRNVVLVDWVAESMQMGGIFGVVDEKLEINYVKEEMELVLGLGLVCSHPKEEARPNMRQVMKYLNGDEVLPLFDKLSLAGSRRVDRFLALLGLSETITSNTTRTLYNSSSLGTVSSSSFDSGR